MLSKLLKVAILGSVMFNSTFEGFVAKDADIFLLTLLLKNEVQINKNNHAMMLFMSKQVSMPKISSLLQKINFFFSEHKLKKALRDTLMQVALYGLLLTATK